MKIKELVNNKITESTRYGKIPYVRLSAETILQYLEEENYKTSLKQRKKLQKLVDRTNNAISLRKVLRALNKSGDLYQIKNRLVRNGLQVVDLKLGTFITTL